MLITLGRELHIQIFKFVNTPISLIQSNRVWHSVSQDKHAKAAWLLHKYGKAHALFHAIRFGNKFITLDVLKVLISNKAIVSRYFIQRLIAQYGSVNKEKLLKLESKYYDILPCKKELSPTWSTDLSLVKFAELLIVLSKSLYENEQVMEVNDMILFKIISASEFPFDHAAVILNKNDKDLIDLISNKKFIPFPPRQKPDYEDTIAYNKLMYSGGNEVYPLKDGYENDDDLFDVARAILIYPELVRLWKNIGYYEICNDLNYFVILKAINILFFSNEVTNWEYPTSTIVANKINELIKLGFVLTDSVMEEGLHSIEIKLNLYGEILLEAFRIVTNKSKSAITYTCFIEAIKPGKCYALLEFLFNRIDSPQTALIDALEYYRVGFKCEASSIKKKKLRSLSVNSNLYYLVLEKYGPNTDVFQKCFEDILESRIWLDLKLQESANRNITEHITEWAFDEICSVYLKYCNENVLHKPDYSPYLRLVNNVDILKPFNK